MLYERIYFLFSGCGDVLLVMVASRNWRSLPEVTLKESLLRRVVVANSPRNVLAIWDNEEEV